MRTPLAAALALVMAGTAAPPASAQPREPLPPIVADVRTAFVSFPADPVTAADLGIDAGFLPTKGLAATLGVHVFPFRRRGFAIGAGVDTVLARAGRRGGTDLAGAPLPDLDRRFAGLAGVVSLNFGGRDGWSYLSGGAGPLRYESTSAGIASARPPATLTANVGGGARWFTTPRLAVGFDVRGYLFRPAAATPTSAGRDRGSILVMSVGLTVR